MDDLAQTTTLDRIEVLDLLESAFEGLDPDDRAMVVMHHLEDRPLAEIAEAMHMPVGTVKWRLHEARQALQRALEAVG
jgi:RNA polymerase sigma-70 factor (ECF subfamily)